jgi:DNA-binding NarL/FixJ family response regulator
MVEHPRGGVRRFRLLEIIHQYAREKLSAAGEATEYRDRQLQFVLEWAEATGPKLTGRDQQRWLDAVEGEYGNLRAALAWSLDSGHIEAGLRTVIALYQFWTVRDYVDEPRAWLSRLLERADDGVSLAVRAEAVANAGMLAGFRGDAAATAAYGREAAALAEAAGQEGKRALAWALGAQAYGARAQGDHETAFALAQQEIQLFRELGDQFLLAVSLTAWSFGPMSLGKLEVARAMLDEGLALLRQVGPPYRIAMALNFSGDLARLEQNYGRAQTAYDESIALLRHIGAVRDLASVLHNLGHTRLRLGDAPAAQALFGDSLALHQAQRNLPGVAECLIGFAAVAAASGQSALGARLLAAAVAMGGQHVATAWAATRMEYEHTLTRIRAGLAESKFEAEQAAGRALTLEQAIEAALAIVPKLGARQPHHPGDLTRREAQILRLIADGESNQAIAGELVLSVRTVERHIANIYQKIGAAGPAARTAAANFAFRHGLGLTPPR